MKTDTAEDRFFIVPPLCLWNEIPGASVRRDPHLPPDDSHHEQKIGSEGPEDEQFGAFEAPPRDEVLLRLNQLIVFKRR
ncbi:MAG: hypothetical protein ACLPOO_14890 [Terriglobales bacterium]